MSNLDPKIYDEMLPDEPELDTREPVEALRLFAQALQRRAGEDTDVEVPVTVHLLDPATKQSKVTLSVSVPQTNYSNLVLIAQISGQDPQGYPVKLDPYFAGESFPDGIPLCGSLDQLNDALREFARSPQMLSLLTYMKRHAQTPRRLASPVVVPGPKQTGWPGPDFCR